MYCVDCGAKISSSYQFCPHCGKKLMENSTQQLKCPNCGAAYTENEFFCQNCGHALKQNVTNTTALSDITAMSEYSRIAQSVCLANPIDSQYVVIGRGLREDTCPKYSKAQQNFRIPAGEDAYLIYDNTVLGSCKTGFAICPTGIYCNYGAAIEKLGWKDFLQANIEIKSFGSLYLGRGSFTGGSDGKQLLKILLTMQLQMQAVADNCKEDPTCFAVNAEAR